MFCGVDEVAVFRAVRPWRVHLRAGSELAAELWDGCDAAVSSRLAYPEVRAALAAAGRNHDLDPVGQAAAEDAWEDYWSATRPVELTCGAGSRFRRGDLG